MIILGQISADFYLELSNLLSVARGDNYPCINPPLVLKTVDNKGGINTDCPHFSALRAEMVDNKGVLIQKGRINTRIIIP